MNNFNSLVMIVFIIFMAVPMCGSSRIKVPPLKLDDLEQQQLDDFSGFVYVGDCRTMSRLYVQLRDKLQNLKKEPKTQEQEQMFKNLCIEVSDFRQQYLPLLQQNQLLRDGRDENPDYNPFNSELLPDLLELARQYNFPLQLDPCFVDVSCNNLP